MHFRPLSRRPSSGRRLRLESLESRQMLSATVTATLSGGNLTLTGNKNDAYVEVHETGAATYLITGLNGTKITYGSNTGTSESVTGVTGGLTVNLPGSGSGTQSFELDSVAGDPDTLVTGNLCVTMGNAADTVLVAGLVNIEGNASITTGAGNSVITMYATGIGGTLSIATGAGNQTISIGKEESIAGRSDVTVYGGSACITTGAGNSVVTVVDMAVEESSLSINLGNGNNKVVVGSESNFETDILVACNLSITLGNGNGAVQIDNTQAIGDLTVQTGSGNQTIAIGVVNNCGRTDVTVGGYLYVHTCPGNVVVTILDVEIGVGEIEEEVRPLVSQSSLNPSNLNSGDLAVELSSGNDIVTIGSSTDEFPSDVFVVGNAYVDTGSGNSTFSLQSATILGNLEMSHQAGNTTITVGAYDPYTEGADVYVGGNVTITTSTGNAAIAIGGAAESDGAFVGGCLTITTGTGNATISLTDDEVVGNTSITTGSGNATVCLLDDFFVSNLSVTMSSGNGSLSIRGTTVGGTTTLNGGGNGTLYYDGTDDFVGGLSYSHFKKVTT